MGLCCSLLAPNPEKTDQSHFVEIRRIGKGGFGKVTLDRKLSEPMKGKVFAKKALSKVQLIKSEGRIRIAWRERNILRIVKSPFVPRLHYAFQDEANLYLVLEFLSGG